MKAEDKIKLEQVLEQIDEKELTNLLRIAIDETGEKPIKPIDELTSEEKVAALIYLVDKYPKLNRIIISSSQAEHFMAIEHFNVWDVIKKIGKAVFGSDEKKQTQQPPERTTIITSGDTEVPSWVWIAFVGFMLMVIVILAIIAIRG